MKYITLLRGINVSGQKKIKMADLKQLYETLGMADVITYIQSGNVVFSAPKEKHTLITKKIEEEILKKYGFHVPVLLRNSKDMARIIKNCPFKPSNPIKEGNKLLVTFFNTLPKQNKDHPIRQYIAQSEKFIIKDMEAYLYCPDGYGKSKLSNTFLEKQLKTEATTRNWKTIAKLYKLSQINNPY